jgi:hypothetical protein
MKKLLLIVLSSAFAFLFLSSPAQEVIPASGGNAAGTGGSVSYTVGQVFYSIHTGTTGSVAEGVQQPWEISVVTGIQEAIGIELVVSAFPNPVTDFLILRVDRYDPRDLSYQLFDINGRMVMTGRIIGEETIIDMTGQTRALYLLKVTDNSESIKVFRIIKH